MGMHTCNILLSSSSVLLLWWSMVCVCVLSFFTCWLSFGWRSGTRRDACQLWTRWLAAMWRHLLWSVECGLFVFLFCFSFVFVCVCVCWCCLFFLIYFLSFNPALPSRSLFTCDSSLSYPGVRGCGWGQRQVGSIASCSCNLYFPPHLPACWAVSKNFGGACRVPETPLCSVIRGWGVGSHAILLAGLHTPGRKQPVACCIL